MGDHKLVPVEPTDEMRIAGARAIREHGLALAVQHSSIAYKAMLAAAPTNPPEISSTSALRGLVKKWRETQTELQGEGLHGDFGQCADELEAAIERLTSNLPDTTALKGQ